jgi:hypothetical protein
MIPIFAQAALANNTKGGSKLVQRKQIIKGHSDHHSENFSNIGKV